MFLNQALQIQKLLRIILCHMITLSFSCSIVYLTMPHPSVLGYNRPILICYFSKLLLISYLISETWLLTLSHLAQASVLMDVEQPFAVW